MYRRVRESNLLYDGVGLTGRRTRLESVNLCFATREKRTFIDKV